MPGLPGSAGTGRVGAAGRASRSSAEEVRRHAWVEGATTAQAKAGKQTGGKGMRDVWTVSTRVHAQHEAAGDSMQRVPCSYFGPAHALKVCEKIADIGAHAATWLLTEDGREDGKTKKKQGDIANRAHWGVGSCRAPSWTVI